MWLTRLTKAEGARQAPTATGEIDQRTLSVLAGDFEVAVELAHLLSKKLISFEMLYFFQN